MNLAPQPITQAAATGGRLTHQGHLKYLDGLRAVAALYVVLHHAARTALHNTIPPGLAGKIFLVFGFGYYAVVTFIVLSGFCLMLPVVRGDGAIRGGARAFFAKRARRILPPYYFALALALLLNRLLIGQDTGTPWDDSTHTTALGLVTHLLMLHDLSPATRTQIAYPLWSVSVEWRIYFLFPLFVLGWRRFGAARTTVAVLIASLLLYGLERHSPLIASAPDFLGLFALGMLAAGIAFGREAGWARWQRVPWGAVNAVAAALVLVPIFTGHGHGLGPITDLSVAAWAVSLLILASRPGPNGLRDALSWGPLESVGLFSYSLYLIHAPLLQLLWQYGLSRLGLDPLESLLGMMFLATPLVVGLAYGFSLVCERPFQTKKPAATAAAVPVLEGR